MKKTLFCNDGKSMNYSVDKQSESGTSRQHCEDCLENKYIICPCCNERVSTDEASKVMLTKNFIELYGEPELQTNDGRYAFICPDCEDSYFFECLDCGELYCEDDLTFENIDGTEGYHCNDCLEDNYITCPCCNELVLTEDASKVRLTDKFIELYGEPELQTKDSEYAFICPDCADSYFFECSDCGELYCEDDLTFGNINGKVGQHCEDCLEDKYIMCPCCNESVLIEYASKVRLTYKFIELYGEPELRTRNDEYAFVCPDCANSYFTECSDCGELYCEEDLTVDRQYPSCPKDDE